MHSYNAIDMDQVADIAELISKLRETSTPLILRSGDAVIAQVFPVSQGEERPVKDRTPEGHDAFLQSAGSWSDVDVDELLQNVYASRDLPSRQKVQL